MLQHRFILLVAAVVVTTVSSIARSASGEDGDSGEAAPLVAEWPMEAVTLTDGKVYRGLVQSENPAGIEFLEVRRPRGKPMALVVRPIDRANIQGWERLDEAAQQELRARLERFRRRTLVEGRRMEDLKLEAVGEDGRVLWNHRGQYFTLESTANERMTRRLTVRLGQIFTAYRQLLPARTAAGTQVPIRFFGSMNEYRAALAELHLGIDNPAVYLSDRNQILAGSELNRFDEELARVNRQHQQIREQHEALVAEVPKRVKQLGEDLKKNNVPTAERLRILLAEQRQWDEQRRALARKIALLDRRNAAKFNEVTARMFRRLAHEAFHAYLESYVYPRQEYDVPRWLNEGLAQTFEAGRLEADSLRIDAPNVVALEQLQGDLRSDSPLPLAELLTAGSDTFLAAHQADGARASRAYHYSWGLAYYLAFEQGVLDTPALDAYLTPAASGPIARFEKLVDMPLAAFEARWRQAMLALSTP